VYVESLSVAKDPRRPETNEDRLVCYGQRTFAVIDGVTDKSGERYGGRSGGWHAGRALESALRTLDDEDLLATSATEVVVARLSAAIAQTHERFGIAAEAAADPSRRFAAALAVAHLAPPVVRLLLVGDCGVRLDGDRVWHRGHPVDAVMAGLRRHAFEALATLLPELGVEPRLSLARAYTVHGIGARPPGTADVVSESVHRTLAEHVTEGLAEYHAGLGRELVRVLASDGLLGAARLRAGGGPLAHGALDGFPLPAAEVRDLRLEYQPLRTLELFSDGYFGWPRGGATVAAWERHHSDVERRDPHRIGPFASTKGSHAGRFADDRSILIVRKEPRPR
jgi:hypothetical protein